MKRGWCVLKGWADGKTAGLLGQDPGLIKTGESCQGAEDKGRARRLGNARGRVTGTRGRGYTRTGKQKEGRQALTFPQHEEVRLFVGVEVTEGRQGAPGLSPKELGRDVVQSPHRGRPNAQQRESQEQRRQYSPGARLQACRHGAFGPAGLRRA